ncbi:MAG: protein-glutamate O-methyltransferase CheR [Deltaproteobacteria bacterium]|nr:protein-glutamate O-methyltransferase CheR [Deltaproteobacteria bacterium]MBI3388474.1 protein-glutamate O-methyltransferase CheR [Deltaproteobacteria bacterium]
MNAALGDREFGLLRDLIKMHSGIALNECKRPLLQARLAKRLRQLGLQSYREYYDYLVQHDPGAQERDRFINALTTNTTAFFREPHHFDYLVHQWLPTLRARMLRGGAPTLRIWSSACSTGEEAYSLAITLTEALQPLPRWDIHVLASDIDTEALATGRAGVYPAASIDPVPEPLRQRYFQTGTGASTGLVRVVPRIQQLVTFTRINLLSAAWPVLSRFDCIFCRNVIIYFDAPTKQQVLNRLATALQRDGLLVLGHSESLLGRGLRFHHLGHTIYQANDPHRCTT